MPELPDIVVYVERIRALAGSQPLESLRVQSPFLLRTYDPTPEVFAGMVLTQVERIGKRIVMCFQDRDAGQSCHAGRCAASLLAVGGSDNDRTGGGNDIGADDSRADGGHRDRRQANDRRVDEGRAGGSPANSRAANSRTNNSQVADESPANSRRDNCRACERTDENQTDEIRVDDPTNVGPAKARTNCSQADGLFAVIHLMIAGRLRWTARTPGAAAPSNKAAVALFDFPEGSIVMTEAGTKRRASLHLVRGRPSLAAFDRGGVNVFDDSPRGVDTFAAALRRENRTVKRALTDPSIVDGIGNAYSDEILHRAGLSPYALTRSLDDAAMAGLRKAAAEVLDEWIARLRDEAGPTLPDKVTAFHPEMAVHGKFGKPCPVCGTSVQRLVYAENEANYCPTCQTGGKLLADRALSRLLKNDWPRTLEELENLTRR